jgi:hypothetical protein
MKKIIAVALLMVSIHAKSQNLVLNPSFEILRDTCSGAPGGLADSICMYWDSPTIGSTDYYNKCASNLSAVVVGMPAGMVGVPVSTLFWPGQVGFQYAKDGDAFAGYLPLVGTNGAREYLQGKLSTSLKIGKKYNCYFYVVKYSPDFDSMNNFGVGFTTYHYYDSNFIWQTNGQITKFLPKTNDIRVIDDTLNWIKIEGTFTADSSYRYFTIGNFFDLAHNKGSYSYFLVDDVHVEQEKDDGVEVVESGKLEVYPNPAENQLTVGGNQFSVNTIEVSNVLGQVCIIPPYQGGKGDVSINIAALPSGIYFIKATDVKGNTINGKFVKQ